jgi:ribosomal-protein-serine acetyltransferase
MSAERSEPLRVGEGPVLRFSLDERRWLRLLEEADAESLYAVVDANRSYLARWMPWAAGQTRKNTLEFIRRSRRELADNRGLQMAIVEDGDLVGVIGYHQIDWENRSTSVGYWIAEASQGQGVISRAVHALTEYAFDSCRLNRVEIRAAVDNARSRAIPRRLGFKQEGVLREAERVGDRFVDHAVYAMVASDRH